MTEDLGTPSKPLTHYGAALNLVERTSDPVVTEEGEAWLRVDLAPEDNQVATLRFDNGSGTWDVPLFETGTSEPGVEEVFRVRVSGQDAYIPVVDPADAQFPELAFRHAGSTLGVHNRVEPGLAIPDSGMFQNAIYQFWAGASDENDGTSGFGYPEELAGLSDAAAVGSPILRQDVSDGNGNTFDAGEYDGVDDGHDFSPDASLPTGDNPWSVFALMYIDDNTESAAVTWGNNTTDELVELRTYNGSVELVVWGTVVTGSSVSTGTWLTIGGVYDQSTLEVLSNGTSDNNTTASGLNIQDQNHALAYRGADNDDWLTGYLAEVVVCDGAETESAFSDYHNDRLG